MSDLTYADITAIREDCCYGCKGNEGYHGYSWGESDCREHCDEWKRSVKEYRGLV